MKLKLNKVLVLFPLILILALLAVFFSASKWLESDSGRTRLESALAESLGMPVHVRGEFSVRLLPSIGVSGTDLSINGADGSGPFAHSEDFYVNVEVLPLFRKKLHIIAFTASHGLLDPQQFHKSLVPGKSASNTGLELPRIEHLVLEDFRIVLPGGSLQVDKLDLEDFHAAENSPLTVGFSVQSGAAEIATVLARTDLLVSADAERLTVVIRELDLDSAVRSLRGITGSVMWMADQKLLQARIDWQGSKAAAVSLSVILDTGPVEGRVMLDFQPPDFEGFIHATTDFAVKKEGIDFPDIQVKFAEQEVAGSGCLLDEENRVLNLLLRSDFVNLDVIEPLFSGGGTGGPDVPFDLNLEFSILQLQAAGAVAHDSLITAGKRPDCSILRN